jgi:prepilin-type N-terminal cleavage/methylation domain-containing protein
LQKFNNNKGFSLVELIIVIAIMVALVAVMGPQYIKYVSSSRDAVVTQAAQDVLSVVKAEVNLGTLSLKDPKLNAEGTITVAATNGNGHIYVKLSPELQYNDNGNTDFESICGVDESKTVKSNLVYTITVTQTDISAHPKLEVEIQSTEAEKSE